VDIHVLGTPAKLLARLRSLGFRLEAEGGKVVVTPGSRLTAPDRDAIRACRDELLGMLEGEPPGERESGEERQATPRLKAGASEIPETKGSAGCCIAGTPLYVAEDLLCQAIPAWLNPAPSVWVRRARDGRDVQYRQLTPALYMSIFRQMGEIDCRWWVAQKRRAADPDAIGDGDLSTERFQVLVNRFVKIQDYATRTWTEEELRAAAGAASTTSPRRCWP
jgi:hypothetical protein